MPKPSRSTTRPPSANWPPLPETPAIDRQPGALTWDGPWLGASLTAMCLLGMSPVAWASPIFVPPPGVTNYRLAFVTDQTTTATSSVIETYNLFAASNALTNTNLPSTVWTAIVSTSATSAANNVSCGAACDASVPIFLIDGTEVATSTINLFGGSSGIVNTIDEDQNGSAEDDAYVWTGSNTDGTAAAGLQMGTSTPMTGWNIDSGLMLDFSSSDDSDPLPIYVISGELSEDVSAAPEPASLSLLAFGGIAMALSQKFRRRRRTGV
jgi:hypothetical protein